MNAETLLNDLTRRGVRLEPRGDRLHVEAPNGVLSHQDREALREWKPDLMALLSTDALPTSAMDHSDTLRKAWRRACTELGEACGWPELPYRPGHAVAPGAALWAIFLVRASVPDLQCVLVALRERIAGLPFPPQTEEGTDG